MCLSLGEMIMLVTIGKTPESDFNHPVGMLRDCHKRIAYFLETLVFAGNKFHGLPLPNDVRSAVLNSLRYFREAAPNHTADEEKSLFPRMRASITQEQSATILMESLESEHRSAEIQHEAVDELFRSWISHGQLGADDSESLLSTLARLKSFYAEHIRNEELTIFPLAEESLSDAEIASIGIEMAARRGVRFSPSE
jgi:hemerythrin-like domain-containing protein